MRKIVLTEWVSLDGFTSGMDNDMSFVGDSFNDEMGKYESDIIDTADTLLLGKLTYQSFAGSWPDVPNKEGVSEAEKDYARRLNAMKKIVISKSLEKVDWEGSELWKNIDADKLKALKEEDGRDILIYGSASIVQQLTDLELIDEYQLLIMPAILGDGTKLFKNIEQSHKLKLIDSKVFSSGVVVLTYQLLK